MDEQAQKEFAEIRAILAQTAQIQRETAVKQDCLEERQAQNAEAISQLTSNMEQLRQAVVNNAANNSDTKAELARHVDNSMLTANK